MNTVITIVVLLAVGGFIWNRVRNGSDFGGWPGRSGGSGGSGGGGSRDDQRDDEVMR